MIIHTEKELTDHINACIAVGCGVELELAGTNFKCEIFSHEIPVPEMEKARFKDYQDRRHLWPAVRDAYQLWSSLRTERRIRIARLKAIIESPAKLWVGL